MRLTHNWHWLTCAGIVLAGCLGASPKPSGDDNLTEGELPHPDSAPAYLTAEAEGDPGWTTRTTWPGALYGIDNRPDAGSWHTSTKHARTGERSWTFQDEQIGRYHEQALYDLHLPPIDLTAAKHPELRFHYRGESESGSGDEFSWEASAEGGTYEPLGSTDLPAADWTLVTADLSAFAGGNMHLVLRFEAGWCGAETMTTPICGPGTGEGYFVDDIEIVEV